MAGLVDSLWERSKNERRGFLKLVSLLWFLTWLGGSLGTAILQWQFDFIGKLGLRPTDVTTTVVWCVFGVLILGISAFALFRIGRTYWRQQKKEKAAAGGAGH
jgi:hypothetical protein